VHVGARGDELRSLLLHAQIDRPIREAVIAAPMADVMWSQPGAISLVSGPAGEAQCLVAQLALQTDGPF
jgi:hypothetical protein